MLGLARNLPANVALFEQSPVLKFESKDNGYIIHTEKGKIHSDRLVLACGVFLEQFGIARRRYVPMGTYASMTAPLNDDERQCLG